MDFFGFSILDIFIFMIIALIIFGPNHLPKIISFVFVNIRNIRKSLYDNFNKFENSFINDKNIDNDIVEKKIIFKKSDDDKSNNSKNEYIDYT